MKLNEIILISISIIFFNFCKTTYPTYGGNPYHQGCTIKREFGVQNKYDISDYLGNIRNEIKSKIEVPDKLIEILLTETNEQEVVFYIKEALIFILPNLRISILRKTQVLELKKVF